MEIPGSHSFLSYATRSSHNRHRQLLEALDGMSRKFANPYVIFYPTVARDGMPFPENKAIKAVRSPFCSKLLEPYHLLNAFVLVDPRRIVSRGARLARKCSDSKV